MKLTPKPFIVSRISFLSAPPRIVSSCDYKTVSEASVLNLFCNAIGKPALNITWTRVLEDGTNSKVWFVGSSWVIGNITRNFTGQYRCTADNGIGSSVNHTISVNVLCEYTLYFQLSLILFFCPSLCEPALFAGKFSCHVLILCFSIEDEILKIMVRLVYELPYL